MNEFVQVVSWSILELKWAKLAPKVLMLDENVIFQLFFCFEALQAKLANEGEHNLAVISLFVHVTSVKGLV